MNDQIALLMYVLAGVFSISIVICLVVLCVNVSKIRKNIGISESEEYLIQKKMGDVEKAYYHLQRDFIKESTKRDLETYEIREYYRLFTELGYRIPDFEQFKDLEKFEKLEQGRDGEWI
jgi:hypothetical protein